MFQKLVKAKYFFLSAVLFLPAFLFAATEHPGSENFALIFLWIAVLLIAAKVSSLVEKVGQPGVLGELVMGIILGNLALAGITFFEPIKDSSIIHFLAEIGVVTLLFQIGLESNLRDMVKVGWSAMLVAVVGVIVPFILGTYVLGPVLLPGQENITYLFLGAALTATSVGITARVFKDLKSLSRAEAQIVLGAAVIDDVLGLIILAVVSGIATGGAVSLASIAFTTIKAFLFLAVSITLGRLLAPRIGLLFSKIHSGAGMKLSIALSIGLVFAFLAQAIGLASIVGAFAAGLILDSVCFRTFRRPEVVEDIEEALRDADPRTQSRVEGALQKHTANHIEDLIHPVVHIFVPIFFVLTGMGVDLTLFFDQKILLTALVITLAAIVGKIVAGFVAFGNLNRWLIGWGMVPRGEVGLIFATLGLSLGVVPNTVFSVIVLVVILTTLVTPPILSKLLKPKRQTEESSALPDEPALAAQ